MSSGARLERKAFRPRLGIMQASARCAVSGATPAPAGRRGAFWVRSCDGVPVVPCEATKIQQVFLNILRNGAEAMVEARGHEAGEEESEPRFVLRVMREGDMARIEIEDNGPGMSWTTRKRAFEPFFTTKGPGAGTGLGLSVSYFIITENHGGTMAVASAGGNGTTFTIRLPLWRKAQ
jgi:signal transduction histidine kinase